MPPPKLNIQALSLMEPWEWPAGAGPVVAETLVDKAASAEDRQAAAQMAGDLVLMNDGMAALLLRVLEDTGESTELRAQAAISLGPALDEASISDFDDPDLEPSISEDMFHRIGLTLMKIHADTNAPKELRRRSLEAAVRAPEDWHREAIRTAFTNGDAEWKLTAVFGMQYVRGFDKEILTTLNSTDPDLQAMAITAAGNGEIAGAWPHVERLLRKPGKDKALLLAAIEAAASINLAKATPILQEFEESEDEEIAEAATEALMLSRDPFEGDEDDDDNRAREWMN